MLKLTFVLSSNRYLVHALSLLSRIVEKFVNAKTLKYQLKMNTNFILQGLVGTMSYSSPLFSCSFAHKMVLRPKPSNNLPKKRYIDDF